MNCEPPRGERLAGGEYSAVDETEMPDRQGEPLTTRTDPYRLITCGACGRTLDTRDFWGFPQADVDPAHIHLIADARAPAYGIFCTCRHYTLYVNPENVPLGLPSGVQMPWAARK